MQNTLLLNGITVQNAVQKCPCDGFQAVAQKSMFIFNRMSRRWYPVFAQTLRSNSKKEKTGIVAKKCYPQNSSRASIRHTDRIKLITGDSGSSLRWRDRREP